MKVSMSTAITTILVLGLSFGLIQSAKADVKIGMNAPTFSIQDETGTLTNLTDFTGKYVVLEWTNPDCPFVKRHTEMGTMKTLAEKYAPQGVVWIAINSTHYMYPEQNLKWKEANALPYHILRDNSGKVGKAYGAKSTPTMFVINPAGKIAYAGAIDNDSRGTLSDGRINYVDQALTELLANKTISVAEAKAYGCSVKYAS